MVRVMRHKRTMLKHLLVARGQQDLLLKKKNKKVKTGNAILIQEGVTSIASSANEYISMRQGKFTIEQVMKHVIACGADYGSDEHYIASELFVKKEQREMWMTMPTDEIRFNW
ncbi:unnamed protein product, partial [Urochloa humidicola]